MLHGVDVSVFQQSPATWRAEAGSFDFAGVKFTELSTAGAYHNPTAAADWSFLKSASKGRIAYCYGHPSVLPSATVELLEAMLRPLGLDDGDGICLDLETNDGLSAPTVAAWARATTAAMRAVFQRPCILYSDLGFFEAGNCAGCQASPLWIADISRPAGQPRIPAPWKTFALHQFSWVPLDRDVANFPTLAAMRAAIGKTAPARPRLAPEDPMLLLKGAGATTPFCLPTGCQSVRLYAAQGTADVKWNLVGEPVHDLHLGPASSEVITLPAGKHAVRFVRVDGGTNDVCAVAQA